MPNLAATPPQLLASLAISVGVVVLFIANLFVALGQASGTAGNVRLLQFLSPSDVAVGAIMIVAVALVVLLPSDPPAALLPSDPPASATPTLAPATVRMTAGIVAAFVTAAAFVRAITVLTVSHQHAAVKLGNLIDALAAIAVAGIGALWGLRTK